MSKPAYVWRGGARPLNGVVYEPGTVLDDEMVLGLKRRDALLAAGLIKVEMVERQESSEEAAPAPAVEDETYVVDMPAPKPKKKTAAKKPAAKKVKAEPKEE